MPNHRPSPKQKNSRLIPKLSRQHDILCTRNILDIPSPLRIKRLDKLGHIGTARCLIKLVLQLGSNYRGKSIVIWGVKLATSVDDTYSYFFILPFPQHQSSYSLSPLPNRRADTEKPRTATGIDLEAAIEARATEGIAMRAESAGRATAAEVARAMGRRARRDISGILCKVCKCWKGKSSWIRSTFRSEIRGHAYTSRDCLVQLISAKPGSSIHAGGSSRCQNQCYATVPKTIQNIQPIHTQSFTISHLPITFRAPHPLPSLTPASHSPPQPPSSISSAAPSSISADLQAVPV